MCKLEPEEFLRVRHTSPPLLPPSFLSVPFDYLKAFLLWMSGPVSSAFWPGCVSRPIFLPPFGSPFRPSWSASLLSMSCQVERFAHSCLTDDVGVSGVFLRLVVKTVLMRLQSVEVVVCTGRRRYLTSLCAVPNAFVFFSLSVWLRICDATPDQNILFGKICKLQFYMVYAHLKPVEPRAKMGIQHKPSVLAGIGW